MAPPALKRAVLELLLERSFPCVVVDTTYPGVDVPLQFRGKPLIIRLIFEVGPQIPDLKLTDEGWTATLSFAAEPYFVTIPWGACAQFTDGSEKPGYVFGFASEKPTVRDLPPVKSASPKPRLSVVPKS